MHASRQDETATFKKTWAEFGFCTWGAKLSSSAGGASILEAPKAPRGWGAGRGVPSPPKKIFEFSHENCAFC
jgi:hypothetical protein